MNYIIFIKSLNKKLNELNVFIYFNYKYIKIYINYLIMKYAFIT